MSELRLSVVIPVLGSPAQMDDALASVLQNRPGDCEIIVVHNRPYDDPYELSGEVRFVEEPQGKSLAALAGRGIALSRSPIVHLLSCGIEVCEDWAESALAAFDDPEVGAVCPVIVDRANQRPLAAGVRYQGWGRLGRLTPESRLPNGVLPNPDFATAIYRKAALDRAGPLVDRFGDRLAWIDRGLGLMASGYRCVLEPRCRLQAAGPVAAEGPWTWGCGAERLFWRWLPQVGRKRRVAAHALLLAAECASLAIRPSASLTLLGRLWGWATSVSEPPPAAAAPARSTPSLHGPHFCKRRVPAVCDADSAPAGLSE